MEINVKLGRDRIRHIAARRKKVQEESRRIEKEITANKRAAGIANYARRDREAEQEWRRQRDLKIIDTRDLTGQLMGDPIPGDPRRAFAAGGEK